jgi:hypothetical protein
MSTYPYDEDSGRGGGVIPRGASRPPTVHRENGILPKTLHRRVGRRRNDSTWSWP